MKKLITLISCFALILSITLQSTAISSIIVKGIKLNSTKITLKVGDTSNIKVSFSPTNTTQTKLEFVSNNKNVATVSETGVVKAVHAGDAIITVYTIDKKISAKCNVTVSELNEVTLKFYFGGDKKSLTEKVWGEIEKKEYDVLKAKFDVNFIPWSDYKDKLMVMSASGDNWDLNFDADWMAYFQMSSKGAYLGLNSLLPKYAPTVYSVLNKQGAFEAVKVKGQITAIPWGFAQNTRPFAGWRADLIKKAGLNYPNNSVKTIEDYGKVLYTLKKSNPDMKIFGINVMAFITVKYEMLSIVPGLDIYINLNDPKFKAFALESHPGHLEGAKIGKQWYDDGIIYKDAMIDKSDQSQMFNTGKLAAIAVNHEWAYANRVYSDPTIKMGFSELYPDKKQVDRASFANVIAINRNAANPERALMFCEEVEKDKDLYDLMMYGIKEETYVLEGRVAKYPAGMDATTSNYMDWGGQWAFWKPQFMRPNATYPNGFWKNEVKFANRPENVVNPLDGFTLNTDKIKNEIAKRTQIQSELGTIIAFGAVKDVKTSVKEYVEKQKSAGLNILLAEIQKQLDAFRAAKK